MKRSFVSGRLAIFVLVALCVILSVLPVRAATYRQGSRGGEVRTIQTKLKRWGYYSGSVDGVYGAKTVEAVKYFQRQNGLTEDGVCGAKTVAALGISSSGSSSSSSSSSTSRM